MKLFLIAAAALGLFFSLAAADIVTTKDLKTAWGSGKIARADESGVTVAAADDSGPAALNAYNGELVADTEYSYRFAARGNVKLQMMANFTVDGKGQRQDLVMPAQLSSDRDKEFSGKFKVPANCTRLALDIFAFKQTGEFTVRDFVLAGMPKMPTTMVMDEFFRKGELINSVFSETIPAGWTPYRANGAAKDAMVGGLSKIRPLVRADFYSLAIPAAAAGSVGWVSRPVVLYRPLRPLTLTVQYSGNNGYRNNQGIVYLNYLDKNNKTVKIDQYALPAPASDKYSTFTAAIKPEMIPNEAESFTVALTTANTAPDAAGELLYGLARIQLPVTPGTFAKIRGGKYANWFTVNDVVSFQAEGELPAGASKITGRVFDEQNRQVAEIAVTPAEMAAGKWVFPSPQPGLYEVEFTAVTPKGEILLGDEYLERAPNNQIALFERKRHAFQVTTPRDARYPASKLFGYQLNAAKSAMNYRQDNEVKAIKAAGGAFARFHITWFDIEPEKGKFDWEAVDYFVNKCVEAKVKPVLCFYGTPRWASNTPDDTRYVVHVWAYNAYAPRDLADWQNFVTKLVERYRDRVETYEVWNEPHMRNYSCYWHDTPENFVAMLQNAYQTIKKLEPAADVWIGGIGMRYLPFYDRIIELGAGKYFDKLALHGHGVSPAPFYLIDKKYNSPTHPWVDSEWHASLIRYTDPAYKLNENQRTVRLMLDLFSQIKQGAGQIAFFEPFNLVEKEALELHSKGGAPLNHASGIFRNKPYNQPLLGASVMANFGRMVSGDVKYLSEYRFGNQKAMLFASDMGKLLVVWQETAAPEAVEPAIASAIAAAKVESQTGNAIADPAKLALQPYTMYFALNPQVPGDWTVAANVLKADRAKLELEHKVAGCYMDQPLFDREGKLTNAIQWNDVNKNFNFAAFPAPFQKPVRFALSLTPREFYLVVEATEDTYLPLGSGPNMWQGDSVEFAIDTTGEGYAEDRIEFVAGGELNAPELVKTKNPSLVGDLPTDWTPENVAVRTGQYKIVRDGKVTRYLIKMPISELYPMVPKAGQPLRFALQVNENDGKNRIGAVQWASGILSGKDPVQYGDLKAK